MPKSCETAVISCSGVLDDERCWCQKYIPGGKQRKKCQDCGHAESSHPTGPRTHQALSEKCKGVVGKVRCECPIFVRNGTNSTCEDCGHSKGAHPEKLDNANQVVDDVFKSIDRHGIGRLTARTSTEVAIRETNAGLKRTPLDIKALTLGPSNAGSTKFKGLKKKVPKPATEENVVKIGALALLPFGRPEHDMWKTPGTGIIKELRRCGLYFDYTDEEMNKFLQFQLSWNTEQIDTQMIRSAFPRVMQYLDAKHPIKKEGGVHWLLLEKDNRSQQMFIRKEGDRNISGRDLDEAKGARRRKKEERIIYFGTKRAIPPEIYLRWGKGKKSNAASDSDVQDDGEDRDPELEHVEAPSDIESGCDSDTSIKTRSLADNKVTNSKGSKGKQTILLKVTAPISKDRAHANVSDSVESQDGEDNVSEKDSLSSLDLEEYQRQLNKLESKLAQAKDARQTNLKKKHGEVGQVRKSGVQSRPSLFLSSDEEPAYDSGVNTIKDNNVEDTRNKKRKSVDLSSTIVKTEVIELSDSGEDLVVSKQPVYHVPVSPPLIRKKAKHEKGERISYSDDNDDDVSVAVTSASIDHDDPIHRDEPLQLEAHLNNLDPFADWRAASPVVETTNQTLYSSITGNVSQLSPATLGDMYNMNYSSHASGSQAHAGPGPSTLANAGHKFLTKIPRSNSRLWN